VTVLGEQAALAQEARTSDRNLRTRPFKGTIRSVTIPIRLRAEPIDADAGWLLTPLQNRTVDLLLTIDHQQVPETAVNAPDQALRWLPRAETGHG
jgi:hypothetical protein